MGVGHKPVWMCCNDQDGSGLLRAPMTTRVSGNARTSWIILQELVLSETFAGSRGSNETCAGL